MRPWAASLLALSGALVTVVSLREPVRRRSRHDSDVAAQLRRLADEHARGEFDTGVFLERQAPVLARLRMPPPVPPAHRWGVALGLVLTAAGTGGLFWPEPARIDDRPSAGGVHRGGTAGGAGPAAGGTGGAVEPAERVTLPSEAVRPGHAAVRKDRP